MPEGAKWNENCRERSPLLNSGGSETANRATDCMVCIGKTMSLLRSDESLGDYPVAKLIAYPQRRLSATWICSVEDE